MDKSKWGDKPEVKKGDLGENIFQDYLEKNGWIIYRPATKDKAHWFDMIATRNKRDIIAMDVKTKARFNNWAVQGIDKRTHAEYISFIDMINVPFYLVFIDDKCGDVYWAELVKLTNPFYPPNAEHIIAWWLRDMKFLFNIGQEAIIELSKWDKRHYDYKPVENKHYNWQDRKDLQ